MTEPQVMQPGELMKGAQLQFQAISQAGQVLPGAKLFTAGEDSRPQPAFYDRDMTIPATNPIFADAQGWITCWLDPARLYHLTLTDYGGKQTVWNKTVEPTQW